MTKRGAEEAVTPSPLESSRIGQDFFGYYREQVAEITGDLDENIPLSELLDGAKNSSTGPVGAKLSNIKVEKLNALLRLSVRDLVPEVVEVESRAHKMLQMTQLKNKKPATLSEDSVEDDIQLLMKTDPNIVKEIVKKISKDLFARLDNMEQQLEKLLDDVVTTCRPMRRGEKRDLQKSIKELGGDNLVRVAGIIKNRYAALGREFTDEVVVNLEEEDNVMLWRLHYYIKAVKSARELSELKE